VLKEPIPMRMDPLFAPNALKACFKIKLDKLIAQDVPQGHIPMKKEQSSVQNVQQESTKTAEDN
jgi:hypothetical protein